LYVTAEAFLFAVSVLDDVGIESLLDEAAGAVDAAADVGCLLMTGAVTEVLEVDGLDDDDDDDDVCLIVFDDESAVESSLNNGFFFIGGAVVTDFPVAAFASKV
jgi:hypothetical protein